MHPYVEDFYTTTQRETANKLFSRGIVGGIAAIFVGVMLSATLGDGVAWVRSAFLVCVAAGVALLVYASLMHGRIDVGAHPLERVTPVTAPGCHESPPYEKMPCTHWHTVGWHP